MTALLIVLAVLAILVVVVVVVAMNLDPVKSFSRSLHISATADAVHQYTGDLKQWAVWGPWSEQDPTMTWEYSEKTSEVGSWMSWKGKKGPPGKLEITSLSPQGIEYTLTFQGFKPATGAVRYAEDGDGVNVTWSAEMNAGGNLIGRLMMRLMSGAMNKMFDKGLAKLKALAEAKAQ
jgi:carbon monoxide dehydrogenase subunit G